MLICLFLLNFANTATLQLRFIHYKLGLIYFAFVPLINKCFFGGSTKPDLLVPDLKPSLAPFFPISAVQFGVKSVSAPIPCLFAY